VSVAESFAVDASVPGDELPVGWHAVNTPKATTEARAARQAIETERVARFMDRSRRCSPGAGADPGATLVR
jgi:hypothetical protein